MLVLYGYGVWLGVRVHPTGGNRRYGPDEQTELKQVRQGGIEAAGFVRWLTS